MGRCLSVAATWLCIFVCIESVWMPCIGRGGGQVVFTVEPAGVSSKGQMHRQAGGDQAGAHLLYKYDSNHEIERHDDAIIS